MRLYKGGNGQRYYMHLTPEDALLMIEGLAESMRVGMRVGRTTELKGDGDSLAKALNIEVVDPDEIKRMNQHSRLREVV